MVRSLEQATFPDHAERIAALYNADDDTLLLSMLGQEYVIRHEGIHLRGQKAPEIHAGLIHDYLFSSGTVPTVMPWKAIADFSEQGAPDFRKKAELPLANYAAELVARSKALLPMIDAEIAPSMLDSDLAITVRALPKVYLHLELSQETEDFPAEAWVLFSNNASEFLTVPSLQSLAEVFKDRLLSLLRIY